MPRFTRGTRRAIRRTQWFGHPDVGFDTVSAGNTTERTLLDMESSSDAAGARLIDPTLIRIRGQVGIDAALAPSQTSGNKNVVVGAVIYVAEASIPNLQNAASATEARFSSDNILWTNLGGFSSEWSTFNSGVSLSEFRIGSIFHHIVWQVDIKAMRRLGDRSKIFIRFANYGGTGAQLQAGDATFYYTLRSLLKE